MTNERIPFAAMKKSSTAASNRQIRLKRFLMLLLSACTGVIAGSYVSAELLYFHYPDEIRSLNDVFSNTIDAVLSSPLSMTFGVFPTTGFYGSHGILVIPGVIMAIAGSFAYYRHGRTLALLVVLVGFALWSHNNYLGISALMSV